MLAGSWALTRSPWLALRRSAQSSRTRTYTCVNASVLHGGRLHATHHTTDAGNAEDVFLATEDTQSNPKEVFEDYVDEYSAVASMSKPPRPSVLEVIDNTLPAILPPLSTDSLAIFEDESSEYCTISISSNSKQSLNDVVLGHLTEQNYEEAYKILVEMKQLGHRIRAHRAYEAAAIATLDDMLRSLIPSRTFSEHIALFETFFLLIPSSRASEGKRTFNRIRKRILDNPLINTDLVIRFSSILVTKGYTNLIQKHTIPFIARFASSDVCFQFINDAIVTNKRYWLSQQPPDERNAIIQSWNLRSTMVHWLAFSNRIDEAISLLPRDESPHDGFRLSKKTHSLLRFRLEQSSRSDLRDLTSYVDNLLRNKPSSSRIEAFSDPVMTVVDPPAQISTKDSPRMDSTLINPAPPVSQLSGGLESGDEALSQLQPVASHQSGALAELLRRLKNAYTSSPPPGGLFTQPPALKEVLGFITSYLANCPDKNGHAIALLRHRVLRLGPGPASHFLFAEMLHYHHAGRPELVIETYVDHFYISALPREDVLTNYYEFRRLRDAEAKVVGDGNDHLLYRIGMWVADLSLSNIRLWPTTGHTSLVWHALTTLAKDDSAIMQLYQKLLQISTAVFTSSPVEGSSITPLVPPSTWHSKLPASAFTPFLRRMLRTSNPTTAGSLGASLLGDMVRAGIEPNVHHLTEIAQFYAQQEDSRRAFMIMERMEVAERENEKEEFIDSSTGDNTVSTATSGSFPAPDIVFYCAVLRAFIQTRNLDDAEKVAARIHKRYNTALKSDAFSSGQREIINVLWRDLAQLRETQNHEAPATRGVLLP